MSRRPVRCLSIVAVSLLSLIAPGAVATLSAQTGDTESAKALKELVAEVRGLRAVIEQYANAQIQAQTVGELLTVQQRRVSRRGRRRARPSAEMPSR